MMSPYAPSPMQGILGGTSGLLGAETPTMPHNIYRRGEDPGDVYHKMKDTRKANNRTPAKGYVPFDVDKEKNQAKHAEWLANKAKTAAETKPKTMFTQLHSRGITS